MHSNTRKLRTKPWIFYWSYYTLSRGSNISNPTYNHVGTYFQCYGRSNEFIIFTLKEFNWTYFISHVVSKIPIVTPPPCMNIGYLHMIYMVCIFQCESFMHGPKSPNHWQNWYFKALKIELSCKNCQRSKWPFSISLDGHITWTSSTSQLESKLEVGAYYLIKMHSDLKIRLHMSIWSTYRRT
jgi:hypothetical protein